VTVSDIGLLVLFVALFAAAAGLALAEVAVLRVHRAQVVVACDRGDRGAHRLLDLIDDLPQVLGTVLLVALLMQVGAATVSGYLADQWFGGFGITAVTVVVTFLLFVYAEAIPKSIAVSAPLRSARLTAPVLGVLVRLLRPIVGLLLRFADLQAPDSVRTVRSALTEEELRVVADEAAQAGEIELDDAALVERSLDFGDLVVRDVFVPRDRVVSVSSSQSVDDALRLAIRHGHRRLPVHAGDLDHVVGVVRLRDLAAAEEQSGPISASNVMTDALEVGIDERIVDVLRQMQTSGRRFALVRERNRVLGIMTIEDVVAELVGEIAEDS
jgi:CBS domain containing-hemolysin-like protein